ncbi:MAG: type II toxin-antitoxin system mRNA interferase toxin, RelE/StbE family [Candidatus Magasanikbacteria bacterium]|nr:type II toxin-antitoxin system mRNA interferase toxin, RelE/StbE family [Candidatus Magasanikbacteria bacterium]
MQIEYSRRFVKELRKAPRKIQIAFRDRLVLFVDSQFSQILKNHKLVGEMKNCRSINITGDWRAIYQELENGGVVFFIMFGTHSQLYK